MTQESRAQRRTERQRVEGRNADGDRNRQRELIVEPPGHARNEGDRHEYRHQHRRGRDDRTCHLRHRRLRGPQRRQAVFKLPLDVLDHHDGIVDDEPDRQHHAQQAQHVQREAHDLHHRQRRDQRHRNGDRGYQGGAPILQEDEDNQDDQAERFGQGHDHVMLRRGDEARGVVVQPVGDALREALRQLVHLVLDVLLQVEGVGARHLEHRQHHGRILAEHRGRGILQGAEFDTRDVAHPHDRPASGVGTHDDVAELLGVTQSPGGVDLHFERGAFRCRRLPDLAGGDLDVLFRDGLLDVDRGDPELGELVRIEPDPHRITPLAENLDVAHARHALQGIDHLQIGVVAQRHRIDRAVRRDQIHDQHEIRILLLDDDAALIDDRRQRSRGLRHAVLHVDRCDAEGIADVEGHRDGRGAVIGTRGRHIGHPLHAVDLLLQRRRHGIGHDLRASAGIGGADDDLRRRDVRKLRDRQQEIANSARQHHDDGDRRREDRTMDEEANHRNGSDLDLNCRLVLPLGNG